MTITTTRRPLTRTAVEAADALTFDAPAPKPRGCTLTISVVYDGFPVAVQFDGTVEQLAAATARLRALGATPPPQPVADWQRTPEGAPICPKHGAVMRQREKQGDVWHSHNVGTEEQPVYCRGYAGKESPGWER